MPNYTYDPTKITQGGLDQMRFELGDTVVDMQGITSPLCDEEYNAIITKYGAKWKKAKLKCLEAIVMKLSFEVTTSVGGLSYSLNERYERWKKMLEEEKKEYKATAILPRAGDQSSLMPNGGTPYFYNDMQTNHRKYPRSDARCHLEDC